MRPYITFHSDALAAVIYGLERADDVIGGTIPHLAPERIAAVLDASAPKGVRMKDPVLHITLSAPEGVRLPRLVWQDVIKHVLIRLGIDPDTHPWIAFRHSDKNCDHVHVPVSRGDFFGKPGAALPDDLDVLCAEIHRDLALRLGFEVPDYPVLAPHPRLHSRAPKRRGENPLVAALHEEVAKTLVEDRPDTVEKLAGLLPEPFSLGRNGAHPAFRINGRAVRVKDLKPDLTSQGILARLSHVVAIRKGLRLLAGLAFVQRFLAPASRTTLSELAKDIRNDQPTPVRTAAGTANDLRTKPGNLEQAGRVAPAARSAGGIERPGDGRGAGGSRDGSGLDQGDDTGNLSPADGDGRAVERDGRDPRRAEAFPRADAAPPSLTVGDWATDLWSAALHLVRRPALLFLRAHGRATVRFPDATRIEVEGTGVALGHVGSGDLAAPRAFATTLAASNPVWAFDAALTPSSRQTRKPRRTREVFVLADLEVDTLRRARQILGLTVSAPAPLFLSATDPAIRAFPDAPRLSTCPNDDLTLSSLPGARPFLRDLEPSDLQLEARLLGSARVLEQPETTADTDARAETPGSDPF